MSRSYTLGGKPPSTSFPIGRFLGLLAVVLGMVGLAGWHIFSQPQAADIHNAPAITSEVYGSSARHQ